MFTVLALLAASAVVFSLFGDAASREPDRTDDRESVRPVQAHALWTRNTTLQALLAAGTTDVVTGTVAAVTGTTPITAAAAGSAPGAPELPRRVVEVAVDKTLHGNLAGSARVVQVLPPGGVPFEEDPPYRPGDHVLLFLRPSEGPAPVPGAYEVVGIDGRYSVDANGRAHGHIPDAPIAPTMDLETEVAGTLKEAAQ